MLSEMDMAGIGTEEHVVVSCNNDASHITKGKRTKRRLRPLSPCAATTTATAVTSSCSSASAGEGYGSFSSTTFEGTDQEEEDMANCLILLAQGGGGGGGEGDSHPHPNQQQLQKQEAENHVEGGVGNKMTESATKSGFYIYECKTCNRTFPSFQALGGHRASHKKPKVMMMMTTTTTQEEKKSPPPPPPAPALITTTCEEFEEAKQSSRSQMKISPNPNPPPVSLELGCGVNRGASFNKCSSKSSKIHECSICGSEFTSGQALGGHMRRHRATASTNNNNNTPPTIQTTFDAVVVDVNNKPRNVLELDLNLPAPEDDLRDSKFQFPTTQKSSMVLSPAPALVGCHY